MDFDYQYGLVALSVAVASLGCFAGLLLTTGIDTNKRTETYLRVVFGGISVGGSIWAMHFIAMLAIRIPLLMTYDAGLTAVSAVIAIVVTGFALATVGLQLFGKASLLVASRRHGSRRRQQCTIPEWRLSKENARSPTPAWELELLSSSQSKPV